MPCYTVQKTSVEFKAQHLNLLNAAVRALGWKVQTSSTTQLVVMPEGSYNTITIDLKSQRATFTGNLQDRVNELKRAYSLQAIKAKATKNAWAVQLTDITKGIMLKAY